MCPRESFCYPAASISTILNLKKLFPRSKQVITQRPVSTLLQKKTQILMYSAKHRLHETAQWHCYCASACTGVTTTCIKPHQPCSNVGALFLETLIMPWYIKALL